MNNLSSHNMPRPSQKLIAYLNTELKLSDSAIKLGLKQSEIEQDENWKQEFELD